MKHVLAAFAFSVAFAAPAFAQTEALTIVSGDKTHTVNVELAETRAAAETGLAGRAQLAADQGLLIDYRKVGEPLSPTMKGVTFDLDMLFMGPDGTVVATVQNARAGSMRPIWTGLTTAAVLEIPAGRVQALGLKPGDKVRHAAFGNAG